VCSLHFTADDYRTTLGGLKVLKDDAVPSVFPWKTPVYQRLSKTSSRRMGKGEEKTLCSHCQEKDREIERLTELLQEKDDEIKVLKSNFISVKSRIDNMTFPVKRFEGSDDDIHFYSGFQNASSYREFMTFVFCHAENMSYWGRNLHGNLPDGDEDSTQTANASTGHTNRALSKEDELFLALARLRLGLLLQHIANLFNISIVTVSRIFTSWINLLYFVLGSLNFWLPKHTIQETMPDSFRKFPSTRVILDATEFKIQTPSSLLRQSQIFSQYKSTTTAKALLGIAPSGSVTFVSQLYTGGISDKEITKQSGILTLLERGDNVMADRGFVINDLLEPLGCTLNIPPFLNNQGQFSVNQVKETQEIANLRIHVERAISRIKTFKILQNVFPINQAGLLNQIWTVCALLVNFQSPIIAQ